MQTVRIEMQLVQRIGAVSPLSPFGTALPEGEPRGRVESRGWWLMEPIAVPPSAREVGEARRERGFDVG